MATIEQGRHTGYFISNLSDFRLILPKDYVNKKKFPKIIKKIGVFNIGYL